MTSSPELDASVRVRTGRLEAFSDGVFAIAVTLLVLEIGIPSDTDGDLLGALLEQWRSYAAYVVSFATIGAAWVGHATMTQHLDSADRTLVRLNLLLLLVVSFIPFPTSVLVEYGGAGDAARVATTFYGLSLLACSLMTFACWRHARRAGLLVEHAPDADLDYVHRRLTPGVGGYVAVILAGLFVPSLAVAGYFLVAVFILVPPRAFRRRDAPRAPNADAA